jgi:hypothetical protein
LRSNMANSSCRTMPPATIPLMNSDDETRSATMGRISGKAGTPHQIELIGGRAQMAGRLSKLVCHIDCHCRGIVGQLIRFQLNGNGQNR